MQEEPGREISLGLEVSAAATTEKLVGGTREAFLEEAVLVWIANQLMSLSQMLVFGFRGHH